MAWTAEQKRAAYARDAAYREKRKAEAAKARKPFSQWTGKQRERHRLYKLNARRAAGVRSRQGKDLWEQNARQAWRWWLKHAPNRWMRSYYRALGRPWSNPRLSEAAAWRIRYWLDADFRARELEKAQTLKAKRAQRIKASSDGTLTGTAIVALFAAAKDCPYCLKRMRSVEKSLDHIHPLSKGGAHSIRNVLVCCKGCNTRKGAKLLGSSQSVPMGVLRAPLILDVRPETSPDFG